MPKNLRSTLRDTAVNIMRCMMPARTPARSSEDRTMTVAERIAVLQTLPPDARVIVQGYESGFNDATGAVLQPVILHGGHQPRPGLGGSVDIPAGYGGG